jgi:hypothetical protein
MNSFYQLNEQERKLVSGGFNLRQELKNMAGGAADCSGKAGEWLDKVSGNPKPEKIAVQVTPPTTLPKPEEPVCMLAGDIINCKYSNGTTVTYKKN